MKTQGQFGQKLDMEKENISNVVCPICEKKITVKTFENWHCEHCGESLRSAVYKNSKKEYIAKVFKVIGEEIR